MALLALLDIFETKYLMIVLLAIVGVVIFCIHSYLKLRHVPGPFLAALSDCARFSWVLTGRAQAIHLEQHRKYGKIVRFGPNMVSVSDPNEIPNIYGFTGKFNKLKSNFYWALTFYAKGKPIPGMFATQDEDLHYVLKRPIAQIYSMSNMLSFERFADSTIRVFFNEIDKRFVQTKDICDLGAWLQYFAFDVIGEITFSRRLGFLERGEDVDGIIQKIWGYFYSAAPVTQMPWLNYLRAKNPITQRLKKPKPNPIVAFTIDRIRERATLSKNALAEKGIQNDRDFLSRFLEAEAKEKALIPPWALTAWVTSNVTAGSDTTAILFRAIFYYLMKEPHTLERLVAELDTAASQGKLSEIVTWKESRELVYLDACIKEAGRMHPPFCLPLERVVPPDGAVICGKHVEGGTIVGISGYTVHRDVETFGEDCDVWRPERWLVDKARRQKMENALFTFGAGHRSCIGKNISYLEIYKLVPTFLRTYELEFTEPNASWKTVNRWFFQQRGLSVHIKKRVMAA